MSKRFLVSVRAGVDAVIFALACMAGTAYAASESSWRGVVTWVSDGDTVRVRPPGCGRPVPVRVVGIDAPEICQTFGLAAQQALRQRVLGREITVTGTGRDDYGRVLGRLSVNGEDIGNWMVIQGYAWSYRYRRSDGPYAREQAQARAAKRGLFSSGGASGNASGNAGVDTSGLTEPIYPAEFRKSHGSCRR